MSYENGFVLDEMLEDLFEKYAARLGWNGTKSWKKLISTKPSGMSVPPNTKVNTIAAKQPAVQPVKPMNGGSMASVNTAQITPTKPQYVPASSSTSSTASTTQNISRNTGTTQTSTPKRTNSYTSTTQTKKTIQSPDAKSVSKAPNQVELKSPTMETPKVQEPTTVANNTQATSPEQAAKPAKNKKNKAQAPSTFKRNFAIGSGAVGGYYVGSKLRNN